jgi:hypothetical protein
MSTANSILFTNKHPANLPLKVPAPGSTTTSAYLHAEWTWEPEMMTMPSVQLKVLEIGDIRQVDF